MEKVGFPCGFAMSCRKQHLDLLPLTFLEQMGKIPLDTKARCCRNWLSKVCKAALRARGIFSNGKCAQSAAFREMLRRCIEEVFKKFSREEEQQMQT